MPSATGGARENRRDANGIVAKIKLRLRDDYFYSTPDSPSDGLPLFADLVGYTAVLALVMGISFSVLATVGAPGPGIISSILTVLLWLIFQFALLHVLVWAASKVWRIANGYAAIGGR